MSESLHGVSYNIQKCLRSLIHLTSVCSPLCSACDLFCVCICEDMIDIISVCDPVLQSEEPFAVRLLFEPSGRPDSQQDYYLTAKENLCVVCGKADSYIRFDKFH